MAEMNVAASVAAFVGVPMAPGDGCAATAPQGGDPFAALLQQQILAAPAVAVPVFAAAADQSPATGADTAADTASSGLAALLPMLIGSLTIGTSNEAGNSHNLESAQAGQTLAAPVVAAAADQLPATGADTATDTAGSGLAALLPMLVGNLALADDGKGKVSRGGTPKDSKDDRDPASAQAELALAVLAAPVASQAAGSAPDVAARMDAPGQAGPAAGNVPAAVPATVLGPAAGTERPEGELSDASSFGRMISAIASGHDPAGPAGNAQSAAPAPAASAPAIVAAAQTAPAPSPEQIAAAPQTVIPATPDGDTATRPELPAAGEPAPHASIMASAAAMAAPSHANPPAHAAAAAIHQQLIETPVGNTAWSSEVGDRMVWMTGNQQNRAELVLTPPQMGRIEISLSVNGDQATALFVSANPAVREALESALPRLREILADAGITLGQAQVGSESAGQSAGNRENGDNPGRGQTAGHAFESAPKAGTAAGNNPWVKTGRGLVDVFA